MSVIKMREALSRRSFAFGSAALAAAALRAQSAGTTGSQHERPGPSTLPLAIEFRGSYLLAVAPNAEQICLCSTANQQSSFFQRRGASASDPTGGPSSGSELRVTKLASGKPTFSARLPANAFSGSFFDDSNRLYVETLAFKSAGLTYTEQAVVAIPTGSRVATRRRELSNSYSSYHWATKGENLIGVDLNNTTRRFDHIFLAALPDFREIKRLPFRPTPEPEPFGDSDLFFSADRKIVAYSTGHTVLCRRTDDLSVVWSHRLPPDLQGASRLALSAEGNLVAIAVIDTAFREQQKNCFVEIIEGPEGRLATRLPLNGDQGVALSPDGSRLALATRFPVFGTGDVELEIGVYELARGVLVASGLHDRVPPGRLQNLNGLFTVHGLEFASDGKHLLSSGNNTTKVWSV